MRKRLYCIPAAGMFMLLCLILFTACSEKENLTFTGTIEQAGESSIMVYTEDFASGDRVNVSYKGMTLEFEPATGQQVIVTVRPDIGETYPVKADAVSIQLREEESEVESTVQENKITSERAFEMIREGGITVVDVRREDEYAEGHIEGAMLLPLDVLVSLAEDKLPDKSATILVYCRSGNRSAKAALQLAGLGYENVYDFGGMIDWPYKVTK